MRGISASSEVYVFPPPSTGLLPIYTKPTLTMPQPNRTPRKPRFKEDLDLDLDLEKGPPDPTSFYQPANNPPAYYQPPEPPIARPCMPETQNSQNQATKKERTRRIFLKPWKDCLCFSCFAWIRHVKAAIVDAEWDDWCLLGGIVLLALGACAIFGLLVFLAERDGDGKKRAETRRVKENTRLLLTRVRKSINHMVFGPVAHALVPDSKLRTEFIEPTVETEVACPGTYIRGYSGGGVSQGRKFIMDGFVCIQVSFAGEIAWGISKKQALVLDLGVRNLLIFEMSAIEILSG
ncbi:hypothetical protein BJX61DRAFT_9563 [Aspergillus egyptiacus]|nr:hypothetical protein BJX61DRAFT_9563 [Aspergillus egyptiacus]